MCGGGIEFGVCKATREEKTQKVTGHVRGDTQRQSEQGQDQSLVPNSH